MFIFLCLFIVGCGNGKKEIDNEDFLETKTTENCIDEKIKLSLEYNPKTDSPRGYDWGYMSESENGYFFGDNFWISYWDKESGMYVPLCSNPDCEHMTKDCLAYNHKKDTSLIISPYYYGGYVYEVGNEKKEDGVYVNLYRIKEDGSEFEQYYTFLKADDSHNARTPELCFHRGYLYYVIPFQTSMKLYRVKLGEDKPEIVYEMSGERQNLYRIKAYGNHVFFQAGNFVDDKMMDINAGIYEYDITTKEIKSVMNGAIREYGVYGNSLYYCKDNGIYELNFTDMSSKLTIDNVGNEQRVIFGEEKIIIWNNGSVINIYEYDGKKIAEVPKGDVRWIKGINNNILFGATSTNIAYYDITSDDKKWKVLDLGIDI